MKNIINVLMTHISTYNVCLLKKWVKFLEYFFARISSSEFMKQPQNAGLKRKLRLIYSTVTD